MATSHYMNQWWLNLLTHKCDTRPECPTNSLNIQIANTYEFVPAYLPSDLHKDPTGPSRMESGSWNMWKQLLKWPSNTMIIPCLSSDFYIKDKIVFNFSCVRINQVSRTRSRYFGWVDMVLLVIILWDFLFHQLNMMLVFSPYVPTYENLCASSMYQG